jgi:hypothetical protein
MRTSGGVRGGGPSWPLAQAEASIAVMHASQAPRRP